MSEPSRAYRVEIPMLVDDAGLSVYAFRLYAHIKRVAGDTGTCWESTRTLAERCGMSVGQVSKARNELVEGGWVTQGLRHVRGGSVIELSIVDKWAMNEQTYRKGASVQDTNTTTESVHHMNALTESVHHMNAGVHTVNAGVHQVNERRSNEEDLMKNSVAPRKRSAARKPKTDDEPTPLIVREAIAKGSSIDLRAGLKADVMQVNTTARHLWAHMRAGEQPAEELVADIRYVGRWVRRTQHPYKDSEQRIPPSALIKFWAAAMDAKPKPISAQPAPAQPVDTRTPAERAAEVAVKARALMAQGGGK